VIGSRRRGSRVLARRRRRLARETGGCRSGAFGMEGDLRMVKLRAPNYKRRRPRAPPPLPASSSIWEDYERSRAWRSSRILNLSRYFFSSVLFKVWLGLSNAQHTYLESLTARLVGCVYSSLVGGMQYRVDWLPDPLSQPDLTHKKYTAELARARTSCVQDRKVCSALQIHHQISAPFIKYKLMQ
jgi:hypothetical protein